MNKKFISYFKIYYRLLVILVLVFSLLIFPKPASASSLVINEIMANPDDDIEWVELYNPTDQTIDLTGWEIKDNANNTDITLSGEVPPLGIKAYDHNDGWLNDNGTEIVTLLNNSEIIDSYTYSGTTPGKTYARFPDGGSWFNEVIPTKGIINGSPPEPTSTPTPTLPTPTKTPTSLPTSGSSLATNSGSSTSSITSSGLRPISTTSGQVRGLKNSDEVAVASEQKVNSWILIGGAAVVFGITIFLLTGRSIFAQFFKKT